MKRSTATGKNRKFVIIIFTCELGFCKRCCPIAEKGSFSFKASDWLARASQCALVLRNMRLKNGFRHVLLNPLM